MPTPILTKLAVSHSCIVAEQGLKKSPYPDTDIVTLKRCPANRKGMFGVGFPIVDVIWESLFHFRFSGRVKIVTVLGHERDKGKPVKYDSKLHTQPSLNLSIQPVAHGRGREDLWVLCSLNTICHCHVLIIKH